LSTRRIYIAYTGGTVGMRATADGFAPAPGYLQTRLAAMPELAAAGMPSWTLREYEPLLDSANMTPDEWLAMARDIAARYDDYDGFIVLHGTDTMAYTASALAFMLEGLAKPVIVTGSQIPICEVRNDARENIVAGLMIAAGYTIPEVCLYFGGRLLRGCRAVKVSAVGLDAFASPNFPPLGRAGVKIEIDWPRVRRPPAPGTPLRVPVLHRPMVGALRLFPGMPAEVARNVLQPPLQGLVLEVYGAGNGPDRDARFLEALREACDRGVVIVACTQCVHGRVDLGGYAAGTALARAGVIGGLDMTAEAALTKLLYLFGKGYPSEEVKAAMRVDLRGELSLPADDLPVG